jgi:DNA polymerase III epsilon subunit-like protein
LTLNNLENKLDIKPIKEEMNKLNELDHECNKRALNLLIFGIKEQQEDDTLEIVKEELKNKSQNETTYLIEEKRLGKTIDHKHRLICAKLCCNDHKYKILGKSPRLKGPRIFINEYLIPGDQAELRKEFQKVKEARKEGKWEIIINRKDIVRDRDQKDNNK